MKKLIILGSGAAGLTAAIYAGRAGLEPLVIAGDTPGGLLTKTGEVENFPGFPDGINGFELMTRMRKQAERFGASFLNTSAEKVTVNPDQTKTVRLVNGEELQCSALIIATGSEPRWLGIEAEKKFIGRGVSACATCDGAFYRNMPVAVVGGGDTAMEEALSLTKFASEVHVIHRRDTLRATKIMAERALSNPKITFHWNKEVVDMTGGDFLTELTLKDTVTGELSTLRCDGCFVALGHIPGTAIFRDLLSLSDGGCVNLQCNTSLTGIEGVFAAGDCADCFYRQAIMAAGMGCRAAMDAARWLEKQEEHKS